MISTETLVGGPFETGEHPAHAEDDEDDEDEHDDEHGDEDGRVSHRPEADLHHEDDLDRHEAERGQHVHPDPRELGHLLGGGDGLLGHGRVDDVEDEEVEGEEEAGDGEDEVEPGPVPKAENEADEPDQGHGEQEREERRAVHFYGPKCGARSLSRFDNLETFRGRPKKCCLRLAGKKMSELDDVLPAFSTRMHWAFDFFHFLV